MIYYIKNNDGSEIVNTLETVCQKCVTNCNSLSIINSNCLLENKEKRNGKLKTVKGEVFLCCGETKTSKLFREKIENLTYAIPEFRKISLDITKNAFELEQQRFTKLVHNIKTINGHSIQELYSLVPQELLTADVNKQLSIISKFILNDIDKASKTFLRVAKHNSQIKVEFSTQEKIINPNPQLEKRFHVIRKVLLNVFHSFFNDFYSSKVDVKIGECDTKLLLDYESIHVAFYHIIENASKYIKPHSTLYINFSSEHNVLTISFKMESLKIEDQEKEKIFEDNFSGINAIKINKAGTGLGMGIIKKLTELNNGNFNVYPGKGNVIYKGFEYSENRFTLDFRI